MLIFSSVPELQGEPEEISKEKARLAAIEVLFVDYIVMFITILLGSF